MSTRKLCIGSEPKLVVHFMRHARAEHKPTSTSDRLTTIVDPVLATRGYVQSIAFANAFQHHARITHILCSPMRRTILTALLAFSRCNVPILALPELQNFDDGPNGVGTRLDELEEIFQGVNVDVRTFGNENWTDKGSGIWSSDDETVKLRIGHLNGFLRGIWMGTGRRGAEVAVVTHGSLLRKWVKNVSFEDVEIRTCVFEEGGLREIDKAELSMLRELSDKARENTDTAQCV